VRVSGGRNGSMDQLIDPAKSTQNPAPVRAPKRADSNIGARRDLAPKTPRIAAKSPVRRRVLHGMQKVQPV